MKVFNYSLVYMTFCSLIESMSFKDLNEGFAKELNIEFVFGEGMDSHNRKWKMLTDYLNNKGFKFKVEYLIEHIDKINLQVTKDMLNHYDENGSLITYSTTTDIFHIVDSEYTYDDILDKVDKTELKRQFFMELLEDDLNYKNNGIVYFDVRSSGKFVVYETGAKSFSELTKDEVDTLFYQKYNTEYSPYSILLQNKLHIC